jgi:hypothetical protein
MGLRTGFGAVAAADGEALNRLSAVEPVARRTAAADPAPSKERREKEVWGKEVIAGCPFDGALT